MEVLLENVVEEFTLLSFEVTIFIGGILLLIGGLLFRSEPLSKVVYVLTLLAGLFVVDILDSRISSSGALHLDQLGGILKILFAFVSIWIIFFQSSRRGYEHYLVLVAIILGSSLMVSANHLLLFYLAIELTSISSYLITGFAFRGPGYEAAIKYLLFGAISSAIMIYGISIIYGLSGSFAIDQIQITSSSGPLFHVGMICILGGLFFKVGLVPYQFWVPSTYQEAPTDAVAILAVVPKIAGFFLIHRVLRGFGISDNQEYFYAIAVFGIITVLLGTFGAIRQVNLKRLLAYGAIAHSGLILPTLLITGEQGGLAFIWYVSIYAIMTMAIFLVISMYENFDVKEVTDMKGIGVQYPVMGSLTLIILIAQIGLPPTAGFTAKFYLFSGMWNEYQSSGSVIMLTYLLVGLLSVVLALFYYLKIPYHSFLGTSKTPYFGNFSFISLSIATIFAFMVLWIFFQPELLNKIAFNINFRGW